MDSHTTTVLVPAVGQSYPIKTGTGLLGDLGRLVKTWTPKAKRVFVVSDQTVAPLYAETACKALANAGLESTVFTMPPGESHKTLATLESLYDAALAFRLTRRDVVVALGGGIVGDVTGYFAATFLRGVPFIQVPTTLLAQVDSSVGGKVAVNHHGLKNMIGAFYHPKGVLIDTDTLKTLTPRDFACGMAEVIKYAGLEATIVGNLPSPNLFEVLSSLSRDDAPAMARVIEYCCYLKAAVVAKDPEERLGVREILNLGHTFAHAFETLSEGQILHGEAVSMGLYRAYILAEKMQTLPTGTADAVKRLLLQHGLPVHPAVTWPAHAVVDLMKQDKKVQEAGQLRFVLPQMQLGQVEIRHDISETDVVWVLDTCQAEAGVSPSAISGV